MEGKDYRILNKVRALAGCGSRPVLLCDSDLFFLRPLLERYDVYDDRDSSSAPAPAQPALSDAPPQDPLRAFTAALERVFALELPQQAAVLEQLMAAKEQLLGKDISLATAEEVLRQEFPVEEPAWAAALQKLLLVFR